MGIVRHNKVNQLLAKWPDGVVHTTTWLKVEGFSDQNLQKYRAGNWIESLGVGAYKKPNDSIDWTGGLQALQNENRLSVYVGGKSALSLLGKAHYLVFAGQNIQIFGAKAQALPAWFRNGPWKEKLEYRRKNLFRQTNDEFGTKASGYVTKELGRVSYVLSSAERAFLEYLDDVPAKATYDEAYKILEGLPDLRSGVMQGLLEACTSIKVKRLFLHLAERVGHPWFNKLKPEQIELGVGKRVVFKNGVLDSKYLITVPKEDYAARAL